MREERQDGISAEETTTPGEQQLIQRMDGVIQAKLQAARTMAA